MIELDGFEECAKITLTEPLVALSLDDFEENRTDDVLGEDLQQHALAFAWIAVDQDAPFGKLDQLFAVAWDAFIDCIVVGVRRVLEFDALAAQHIDRAIDVIRAEGNVLNTLALVRLQVLLDLALVVLRLIDGYANATRSGLSPRLTEAGSSFPRCRSYESRGN